MLIDLIVVPYDSAQHGRRMGRGPLHLMQRGAADMPRDRGHDVREERVDSTATFLAEPGTAFGLQRAIAERVAHSRARNAVPIVLAGNCNTSVGTVSGLGPEPTGVVWLDAHGDLNTPETTGTGFIDGMALAMLTGRCWRTMTAAVPGFAPVPDGRVILVGARDLDAGEVALLDASPIARVEAADVRAHGVASALGPSLDALRPRAGRAYLHLDLDVHDPAEAQANVYAVPDGLSRRHVLDVVHAVADRVALAAAAVTAYDPDHDEGDRMLTAAFDLLAAIADRGSPA